MTFYQELQLNQAGSKKLIRQSETMKEKIRHTVIYLMKIAITVTFCFFFVAAFSAIFGNENSVVGVVTLLSIMVFQNADFGVDAKQSVGLIACFFGLMAVAPHLANVSGALGGLVINGIAICLMIILGGYIPQMSNHSTIVLGYLLMFGYDVSGTALKMRVAALALGCLMTAAVFYRNHREKVYHKNVSDIFKEFTNDHARLKWELCEIICVPLVVAIAEMFHTPRSMWAGLAALAVITLSMETSKSKVRQRIVGNILGGILFFVLYYTLPTWLYAYIGVIGGIGVGFSVKYHWQSMFNTFGALAIATTAFGLMPAIHFRVLQNVFGVLFALAFCIVFGKVFAKWEEKKEHDEVAYA